MRLKLTTEKESWEIFVGVLERILIKFCTLKIKFGKPLEKLINDCQKIKIQKII